MFLVVYFLYYALFLDWNYFPLVATFWLHSCQLATGNWTIDPKNNKSGTRACGCLLSELFWTLTLSGSCGARHCTLSPLLLGPLLADLHWALSNAMSEDELLFQCVCGSKTQREHNLSAAAAIQFNTSGPLPFTALCHFCYLNWYLRKSLWWGESKPEKACPFWNFPFAGYK